LKKEDGQIDKARYSYHHIIPNCELIDLLKSTKTLEKDERKKVLENFLNKDHVKNVIINRGLINKTGPGCNHGKLIHAAVVNNPNNLVYGPGYDTNGKALRGKEPGNNKDTEILEKQTDDYKKSNENYEKDKSLKTFGELPPTTPVNFKQYTGTPKEKGKIIGKYYAVND
jgi:hypothetical protein